MGFFTKLDQHADLMGGMADRVGVDLADYMGNHPYEAGSYRSALFSCAACEKGEQCRMWQETHDHAAKAPGYCRNADWFRTLAAE